MVPGKSNPEQTFLPDESWPIVAERLVLSERETEVARLVLLDLKEFAIARALDISPHTVHTHLDRMYRKLDVSSRLQLAVRLASTYIALVREEHSSLRPICADEARGRCPLHDCQPDG